MMNAEVKATFDRMHARLHRLVPPAELALKAELVVEIEQLKRERRALILGHNYMEAALFHTVCDITGDSLELSRRAAQAEADVLVFCGVVFMAETAKILNPSRTVLVPSLKAGCSLASSITAADVRALRQRYPGVPVVTYINTYADVKAEVDICCTSANAVDIVSSFEGDVIFLPDAYLASNVAKATGRSLVVVGRDGREVTPKLAASMAGTSPRRIIGWDGKCEVHAQFTAQDVRDARKQFPDVKVLAHPECPAEVCDEADMSGSTTAMIRFVREAPNGRYLLMTECAMADNLIAEVPQADILRLCSVRCPHMAQVTLEMTRDALRYLRHEVTVPEDLRQRALGSIERMLAFRPQQQGLQ